MLTDIYFLAKCGSRFRALYCAAMWPIYFIVSIVYDTIKFFSNKYV